MNNQVLEKKLKLDNRFKAQVIENGRVIRETEWKNNLILNQGLDAIAVTPIANLFVYCAIGTGSSTPIPSQTGLDAEVKRSNNYFTGAGNCGSVLTGNTLTHTRTFNFTTEITTVNYAEVGWSSNPSSGANLNTRGLFGSPITVNSGQSLRVIYQFIVTITPSTPRAQIPAPITGWPALQYSVTATGAGTSGGSFPGVMNQPGTTPNFYDQLGVGESFIIINDGGSGVGTGTFYVKGLFSSSPPGSVTITNSPGGAALKWTNGSFTFTIATNNSGNEQRILCGLTGVNSDGSTNLVGVDAAGGCCEPAINGNYIALANLGPPPAFGFFGGGGAVSLPAFGTPLPSGIAANAFAKTFTNQAYIPGSRHMDKQVQFLPTDGGSNRNDWLWLLLMPTFSSFTTPGYAFLFNHFQSKTNTGTLTITLRISW